MIEKNKRCQIEITDVASDGNGVGAIDGFRVFVPMTAKGDICEILIVKVLSHYAVGRLMEIIIPSPDRSEPLCPVFKRCGGCHIEHINYSAQLEIKRGFVEAAMRRIAGFSGFNCDEIIGMDEPWRYRNKCVYPTGTDKNGNVISGFYARRSHDIIPVGDCLTGGAINEKITNAVLKYMKENDVSAYDEGTHSGLVRRTFIRSARTSGEIMVVISINGNALPRRERLIKRLREVTEDIVSVYININTERNNTILGRDNKLIYGKETITDTLCGISFKISPHSFYQINPNMTEKLYGRAIEYADIKPEDIVLDIYCGIGTISLAAARRAKKVYGIEIVEQAIKNARENAKHNGIENAKFFSDSAEAAVPRLIESGICPDTIILDPPRKGSDEVTLNAIVSAQPKRIVYVSCNPATLARDTKYLAERGFAPKKCTAVDMFPHTSHVETVLVMQRA